MKKEDLIISDLETEKGNPIGSVHDLEEAKKKPTSSRHNRIVNLIEINLSPSSDPVHNTVDDDTPAPMPRKDKHRWSRWWDKPHDPFAPWNRNSTVPIDNADEAELQAMLLNSLYGIRPEILKSDKEFYSDETLMRTARDRVYFISEESPIESCKVTETLIREAALRVQSMHANRVQKAAENNQNLSETIAKIKEDYKTSHAGKEPSMNRLAQILNERHVESPRGKESKWYAETVKRILEKKADESPQTGLKK
ncbi:hypothetical protein BN8_p06881 (plasmid) [Fibrisoma limi BUZ 3]|uniref:Uncharacterized protein n=1 Tax=Fibrisoma limi BUZ 3 TaxID=1185876 RepID=I2GU72_9BACT|nr:recombinase family protein [Fibrisoma limi]CCH57673.1 hypothetical protein BN8_p06881 [Fibrisoma limi BUZ 3]